MRRGLRALIHSLTLACFLAVVAGYFAAFFFALDLLAHFRLHFFAVLIGLAAVNLALRNWQAVFTALSGVAAAAAGLGPLWEDLPPVLEGIPLTVMTANLYQYNAQSDAMRAAVRSVDADILITNETTKPAIGGADGFDALYPYRLALNTTGQTLRTVIWSKYPMREGALLLDDRIEPTGAHAILRIDDNAEVSVLGLHFAHAVLGNQERQLAALERIVGALPHPRIILGDFNATPWSHAMRRIEDLTATHRIPGYRVTWCGAYPTPFGDIPAPVGQPIDHILISEGVGISEIATVPIPGSDHDGLRAVLTFPKALFPR